MLRTDTLGSLALVAAVVAGAASPAGADWTRFRGPNGSGVSAEAVPVTWSASKNLKWKIPLPGAGSSCPIVVGDRIFVTCWSGYGLDRSDPGDQDALRRHLICIDCQTGATIWTKTVKPYLPEDEYGGMFAEHGYASHTPVSDGQRVYVFFGKTGVLAFDMEGNQLWQHSVGTESGARNWGSASSPILHNDLVIIPATAESEAMVGLNAQTGEEVWRQEAAGFNSVWGTPVLAKAGDRTDLVIAVPHEVWGLNPDTGKLLWYCDGVPASSFCSSAVAHDGVVYAIESGPGGGGGIAVRVGGSKDVTDSHVVWSGRQSNRIGTPLVYDNRLYFVARKTLTCLDTKTGDEVFKSRLESSSGGSRVGAVAPSSGVFAQRQRGGFGGRGRGGRGGGQDYASPIIANGNIYFQARAGEVYVVKASDKFEQLAVNRVTSDTEDFSATPAVSDGQLFIRSSKHLYCIAPQ